MITTSLQKKQKQRPGWLAEFLLQALHPKSKILKINKSTLGKKITAY